MGMGAIQASFEGSAGREGKYLVCKEERKFGSEGSRRMDASGSWGKCIEGAIEDGGFEDAGKRSGGGSEGGSKGMFGCEDCELISSSNVTFLEGLEEAAGFLVSEVSCPIWSSSCRREEAPVALSSRFALRRNRSRSEGGRPAMSSRLSCSISSDDICASRCLFSLSILSLSSASVGLLFLTSWPASRSRPL